MNAEYYLISALRRAYRLKPEKGSYLFGREESADIVIVDALASRRHAELRWDGENRCWNLVDLKSRNGVFVGGTRIEKPTRIDDGVQMQVGGNVFMLYLLPPGGNPSSLGQQAPQIFIQETMEATAGAAFTGQVAEGGLLELLQFFVGSGKTGRLDLQGAGTRNSSVWFAQGELIHASHMMMTGMAALTVLSLKPPPRFAFYNDSQPAMQTLGGAPSAILLEVSRLVDEQRRETSTLETRMVRRPS